MRQLHLANIANVAYGYAKILRGVGSAADVLCYDLTHILSLPEWADGDFEIPIDDEWQPPLDHPEVRRVPPPDWYRRIRSQDYWIGEADNAAALSPEWIDAIVRASERFGSRWTVSRQDVLDYKHLVEALQAHFLESYDIVFGYAYGAVQPLLASTVPYVAVEIGTLRDTVNLDTPLGRLLGLAYRTAPWTIITNADCRSAAETLELQNYSYVPHPLDEEVFSPLSPDERHALRASLCGSAHLLIAPARQSWEVKANDRYLRAFAELVNSGTDATLLASEWGPDVGRSRQLIAELGITDRVKWFAPAPEQRLARMFSAADLVLDQFGTFGTFGLIAPKAMACGTPCVLSFDPSLHSWCFDAIPPLVAAREEREILGAMRRYLENDKERRRCGALSRAWILAHHSKAVIARKMQAIVEAVVDSKRAQSGFDSLRQQRIALQSGTVPAAPPSSTRPARAVLTKVGRRARHVRVRLKETATALRQLHADRSRLATAEEELKRHSARRVEFDARVAELTSRLDAALLRLDTIVAEGRRQQIVVEEQSARLGDTVATLRRLASQIDDLKALEARLQRDLSGIASRLDTVAAEERTQQIAAEELSARFEDTVTALGRLASQLDDVTALQSQLEQGLGGMVSGLDAVAAEGRRQQVAAEEQSAQLEDTTETLRQTASQLRDVTTLQSQLEQRMDGMASRLDGIAASESQLQQGLMAALELMGNNRLEDRGVVTNVRAELLEAMVRSRLALPVHADGQPPSSPRLRGPLSLREVRSRLRAAAPLNWRIYTECLKRGTASYAGFPPDSCSTAAHPKAELFRAFLRPYVRGRVLDVGCGPQPVPWYLSDYDPKRISGIDPISKPSDHHFSFVSGFGEFLPWEDDEFDVVVSGTSLDHYYLLDRGLQEVFRVLRPGGHFVAWIAEFSGAPPYDPYGIRMSRPYDDEHLFHIDRAWFLPLMARTGFVQFEVLHLELPFHQLFMSFAKPTVTAA